MIDPEIQRLCDLTPEEFARDPAARAILALAAALSRTQLDKATRNRIGSVFTGAYSGLTPAIIGRARPSFLETARATNAASVTTPTSDPARPPSDDGGVSADVDIDVSADKILELINELNKLTEAEFITDPRVRGILSFQSTLDNAPKGADMQYLRGLFLAVVSQMPESALREQYRIQAGNTLLKRAFGDQEE